MSNATRSIIPFKFGTKPFISWESFLKQIEQIDYNIGFFKHDEMEMWFYKKHVSIRHRHNLLTDENKRLLQIQVKLQDYLNHLNYSPNSGLKAQQGFIDEIIYLPSQLFRPTYYTFCISHSHDIPVACVYEEQSMYYKMARENEQLQTENIQLIKNVQDLQDQITIIEHSPHPGLNYLKAMQRFNSMCK